MNARPPRLALQLLERLTPGCQAEAQIGDLVERYQRGRSIGWFWRQTIGVLLTGWAFEVWQHKVLGIAVAAVGTYLPDIYAGALPPRMFRGLESVWYPQLLDSTWSWLVLDPWSYRLELRALPSRLAFCAMVSTVAWLTARSTPRQRGLVTALLVGTQLARCLPSLLFAIQNWLHEPTNPMWFFLFFWFAIFTCVAIPYSVCLGTSWGASITAPGVHRAD